MTTKIGRDAARALTNGKAFTCGNTVVSNEYIMVSPDGRFDHVWTMKLYGQRVAYVYLESIHVQVPYGYGTKTTMDRITSVVDMWGKHRFMYLLKEQGKFFNLGRMN